MGFLALAVLGTGAFGAMLLLGLGRLLWSSVGAALFLGAIGYAWQGRPSLQAAPAQARTTMAEIDPGEIALRDMLLGRYTQDTAYLVAADAMTRSGDTASAARAVMGGLSRLPKSFILWTWAGVTLAADAKDQVTPPALLAFRQAARLAPEHPAPPYYLGLAYVRAGDAAQAQRYWRRALALSPPGSAYGREIAARLDMLDRFLAMRAAGR